MSWLTKLAGLLSANPSKASESASEASTPRSREILERDIRFALTQDGLAHATPETVAFIEAALYTTGEWPNGEATLVRLLEKAGLERHRTH